MSSINTSIVICAFNEENCLLNCLQSVRSEIIENSESTELIIVDNESIDSTADIALNFINDNNEELIISYLRIKHVPLTSSRNTAISFCRGSYIIFLDADAIAGQYWLMNLLNQFEDNVSIVAGNVGNLNTNSLFAEFIFNSHYRCSLDAGSRLIGANMAFRSSVFESTGGFYAATSNRGDETLFLQEYISNNPEEVLGYAKNSIVYNDFPNNFAQWIKQQYEGGREYMRISKFNKKSYIMILKDSLRAINILFFAHLFLHIFVISSTLITLHFFLFLIRNFYKIRHFYCGFKRLLNKKNIFQSIMFIPVSFLGTMSTDLGSSIEAIISIGKIIDKSNAKVSLVLDKVNSKKYNTIV